jgi:peptidoglycan/LPS O-acetylase OafA/YrhL
VYVFNFIFKKWISRKFITLFLLVILVILPLVYRIIISDYFLNNPNSYIWDVLFRKRVITRLDSIFIGVIGAWFYLNFEVHLLRFKYFYFIFSLIIIYMNNFCATNFWKYTFYFTFNSIAIFFLFPLIISLKKPSSLIVKTVSYLSKISYSLYLLHFNAILYSILFFFKKDKIYNMSAFVIYIVLSLLFAHILYKLVEKPFMNFRERNISNF